MILKRRSTVQIPLFIFREVMTTADTHTQHIQHTTQSPSLVGIPVEFPLKIRQEILTTAVSSYYCHEKLLKRPLVKCVSKVRRCSGDRNIVKHNFVCIGQVTSHEYPQTAARISSSVISSPLHTNTTPEHYTLVYYYFSDMIWSFIGPSSGRGFK